MVQAPAGADFYTYTESSRELVIATDDTTKLGTWQFTMAVNFVNPTIATNPADFTLTVEILC